MSIRADNNDDFYPRPHMEGDVAHPNQLFVAVNFYPRPHMEGDCTDHTSSIRGGISTHALTWRATG